MQKNDSIANDRMAYQETGFWEHETRGACWMDVETVATLYPSGKGMMAQNPNRQKKSMYTT